MARRLRAVERLLDLHRRHVAALEREMDFASHAAPLSARSGLLLPRGALEGTGISDGDQHR